MDPSPSKISFPSFLFDVHSGVDNVCVCVILSFYPYGSPSFFGAPFSSLERLVFTLALTGNPRVVYRETQGRRFLVCIKVSRVVFTHTHSEGVR